MLNNKVPHIDFHRAAKSHFRFSYPFPVPRIRKAGNCDQHFVLKVLMNAQLSREKSFLINFRRQNSGCFQGKISLFERKRWDSITIVILLAHFNFES